MASETDVPGAGASHLGGSTPRKDEARRSVTRTTVTPGPGLDNPETPETPEKPSVASKPSLGDRLRQTQHGELTAAREPLAGSHILRLAIAILMSLMWILTIGGAILMLLLWQQDRASGVLSSQLDRTWDLFDLLREIERWVAFALLPIATAWIAMAAVNVRRATGKRRNPIVAAASLPIAVFGIWIVGSQIVAESDDWVSKAAGFVLQAIFAAIPLLALERVTDAAEARHRPLRVSYVISLVFLGYLQFLGGLSTTNQASEAGEWGKLGGYLVIGGLIQVLAALSVNEAARSVEDGIQNRFQLRQRFGESLLAQAEGT